MDFGLSSPKAAMTLSKAIFAFSYSCEYSNLTAASYCLSEAARMGLTFG
jgi:hypothetical protein